MQIYRFLQTSLKTLRRYDLHRSFSLPSPLSFFLFALSFTIMSLALSTSLSSLHLYHVRFKVNFISHAFSPSLHFPTLSSPELDDQRRRRAGRVIVGRNGSKEVRVVLWYLGGGQTVWLIVLGLSRWKQIRGGVVGWWWWWAV